MIMWSQKMIPIISDIFLIFSVTFSSSGDGDTLPLGWLCAIIKCVAPHNNKRVKIPAVFTRELLIVPTFTLKIPMTFLLLIAIRQKCSSIFRSSCKAWLSTATASPGSVIEFDIDGQFFVQYSNTFLRIDQTGKLFFIMNICFPHLFSILQELNHCVKCFYIAKSECRIYPAIQCFC